MTLRARLELEDSFASTLSCTICGEAALAVVHLKAFPDYVTCSACGAAFVMEDGGERAMYGSIPPDYPETRDFALKQWTSLEAIAALAEAERPVKPSSNNTRAQPAATEPGAGPQLAAHVEEPAISSADWPPAQADAPEAAHPDPNLGAVAESRPSFMADLAEQPVRSDHAAAFESPAESTAPFELAAPGEIEALDEPPPVGAAEPPLPAEPLLVDEAIAEPEREPAAVPFVHDELATEQEPASVEAPPSEETWEPVPGRRFRVRFLGTQADIPAESCAHCLRSSPRRTLVVVGAVVGPGGNPKRATFSLPLCNPCYQRARARTEEERSARLISHLVSILIAAVAVVGALGLGLVPLESPLLAAGLLGVMGIGAYGLPAWLLLARTARFPRPPDALFVRSTLLVSAHPQAGETLFDWRSPGFAGHFQQANAEQCGETIFEVGDPLAAHDAAFDEPAA